jgi:arylsulfatase
MILNPFSRLSLLIVLFSGTLLFGAALAVGAEERQPDIVYIMSDDMGFSDIGCYGSEIATPNLDGLAAHGLRFTQFYNTARCCPTRASLMTGLYPHQAGIGHMMDDRGYDGYRGDLNRNCVTIAEVLRGAGYRTYMTGKWHVTKVIHPQTEEDKHNWPLQRGFDRFYGTISGAGSFFDPYTLTRDNEYISPYNDPEYRPEEFYYTDAISDQAARFIREHAEQKGDAPFFLYVSFTAAHWPMHAREKDIRKYEGKYDAGYQAIRDARYRRMLQLGVIDGDSTVNWPIDEAWKEPAEYRDWDIRNMEVYAAMIDSMDQGIGWIVNALKETGRLDHTLICFFQDNGGCAENYGRGGIGGPRSEQPDFLPLPDDYIQPEMTPKQSRDGFRMRTGKGSMAGPADTAIGYGRGWATVSNTPFREYKHWVHEGGISTPLIVHWPARLKREGELESTPGHLIDLMATAVDVSGASYPETYHDGQKIQPMEGKSLVPAFDGKGIEREAIYWEHEGNRAIRVGDWKLVAKGANGPWELYDISKDRSEQNDLADSQPARVQLMASMWQVWAERANVLPLNPQRPGSENDISRFRHKQARFKFSSGDDVDRFHAPYVQDRAFSVAARVIPSSPDANGVIVAQGGSTHGWSLYLREGEFLFATTHRGQRTMVRSGVRLEGEKTVSAALSVDGLLTLGVDGKDVAVAQLPGPLVEQPLDGLQVGSDAAGQVGDYSGPYPLDGEVESVIVKVVIP